MPKRRIAKRSLPASLVEKLQKAVDYIGPLNTCVALFPQRASRTLRFAAMLRIILALLALSAVASAQSIPCVYTASDGSKYDFSALSVQ